MADILIVDDAEFIRTLLKDILSGNGHHVIGEAANGDEAVMKYIDLKPDLVTMDIVMPKSTGIEAVKDDQCPGSAEIGYGINKGRCKRFHCKTI